MIPGVYESSRYFKTITANLMNKCKIVHAQSIVGFGGDVQSNTKAVTQYLEKYDVDHATIIGHSSGGLVAVKVAENSARVDRVIAIAAPFHGVWNGRLLRTSIVRDLLPESPTIEGLRNIHPSILKKFIPYIHLSIIRYGVSRVRYSKVPTTFG